MKIIDVQGILMSCPLPEPLKLPFYGGERTILKRDAMLIRVKADNGLVGYAPGPALRSGHAVILFLHHLLQRRLHRIGPDLISLDVGMKAV